MPFLEDAPRKPRRKAGIFLKTAVVCWMVSSSLPSALAANITLAWDPPSGGNVTGYKVYTGTQSRRYDYAAPIGNQLTYQILGLPPGTYYFAVTAVDDQARESDFSEEVSTTIAAANTTTTTSTSTTLGGRFSTTIRYSTTSTTQLVTTTTRPNTTTTTIPPKVGLGPFRLHLPGLRK